MAIVAWGKMGTLVLLRLGWLLGGALTYAAGRYALYFLLRRALGP